MTIVPGNATLSIDASAWIAPRRRPLGTYWGHILVDQRIHRDPSGVPVAPLDDRARVSAPGVAWRAVDRSDHSCLGRFPSVSSTVSASAAFPAESNSVRAIAWAPSTRVRMIERHYGTLLDCAGADFAGRLDALDAARDDKQADDMSR